MTDEYIDLGINTTSECNIDFDDNDIVEEYKKPSIKRHLEDGDKLVWYKDPTIVATWHSNGRLDIFDKQNVSICDANFRILKGHWRDKTEHGVGTESNHWLFDDKPISEYLELFPEFWKANEVKEEQPKKERKTRQKKEASEKTVEVITDTQEDTVKEYKYKSEKYLYDSNYSDTYPDTLRKQATPSWVAEDMVDLLPDEIWRTDSKFLDIYCKSGIFLEIIIDRLMKKVDYSSIGLTSDREIRQYIIENQVYAICWNKWYLDLSRKAINGKSSMVGNIYCIGPEVENMTEDEAKAVLESSKAQSSIDKTIQTINIRKEFFNNVKFDIVIGNPPYNNDIYLDFVEKSFELSSNITCMITPAKWQAKGGEKNEAFRQNIVPYMSKIVYYEDETDVFAIKSIGGIAYYLVDKNKEHDNKYIENRQDRISEFNNNMTREYKCKDTLNNFGYNIINKVLQVENLGFPLSKNDKNKRYYVSGSNMTGHSNGRGKIGWFSTEANVQCTCKADIYDSQNNETNKSTVAYTIFSSNDRKECEYFNSYIDTKFVRVLVMFGVCETGCFSDNNWRFVPDPGKFDHIFTDEELYKKYNLTPEEINIIESVIKERK